MTWQNIEAAWHKLVDRILAQWPETSADQIIDIAGDREKFTRYIAECHDLTVSEAAEAVEIWLFHTLRHRSDT